MISSNTQSLNLFHVANETQRLLAQLFDNETGEVNMEVSKQLEALEGNVEKRMVAIGTWIKAKEAEKHQIEFMEAQLSQRKAAYVKEIARWEKHLLDNMQRCNFTQISCPLFRINLKLNPVSVEVHNAAEIPEKFMRTKVETKTTVSPDKKAIADEFKKTGVIIPGVNVQRKLKLEILTDKI